MKQSIDQLCDEEIQPVEIDNKIDNEDFLFFKKAACMVSCGLFAYGIYGTEECGTKEILSRLMVLGIVYLACDRIYDGIYDYAQDSNTRNKKKSEEKQ